MPVEWRVLVDWDSWTGVYFVLPFGEIFSAPDLFLRRLVNLGWADREVVIPLSIAAAATAGGLVVYGVRLIRGKQPMSRRVSFLILIPSLASFVFCLINAPMARYFGAVFWLLAAESVLLAVGGAVYAKGRGYRRAILAMLCVAVACGPIYLESSRLRARSDFMGLPSIPTQEVSLTTGLSVRTPAVGAGCGCWATPLPCTNSPNQALGLRRPNDLESGFMINTEVPWGRHPEADPACQMGKPRKDLNQR